MIRVFGIGNIEAAEDLAQVFLNPDMIEVAVFFRGYMPKNGIDSRLGVVELKHLVISLHLRPNVVDPPKYYFHIHGAFKFVAGHMRQFFFGKTGVLVGPAQIEWLQKRQLERIWLATYGQKCLTRSGRKYGAAC